MFEQFKQMINTDYFFWFCALSGTGLFIIQFLLTLIGVGEGQDDDSMDAGKVKWLSKQAVTGFLMMFGWTALTCKREFAQSTFVSSELGVAMGIVTVIILGYIFKIAKKLQSPGTSFNIADVIGKEAVVYQQIPKGGIGKITLSVHNLTYELDAVANNDEEVASFIPVQIIKKRDDNSVVVVPVNSR